MNNTAVVIGGGLGGLSAALSLKAQGFDVQLFEKNSHLGGKLNIYEAEGFRFDLGPSIFSMPHILEDLFKKCGKNVYDYVQVTRLDLQWRSFFEDHDPIDLYEDPQHMQKEILKHGSEHDHQQWLSYLQDTQKQLDLVEDGYLNERGLETRFDLFKHYSFAQAFNLQWLSSLSKRIDKHIDHPKLKDILKYFIKYVGSSATDSPAMMGLLFAMQMKYGIWYVNGGMFEISKALAKLADDIGLKIHLNADVQKILFEGKKATGITLKDQSKHFANHVVCNQEFIPASQQLIDPQSISKSQEKLWEPACSGLVIHIGTDKVYSQLAHHNFFFSKDQISYFDDVFHKKTTPKDPTLYVVAPSRTDSTVCPEGTDNIKILPHLPYLQDQNAVDYDEIRDIALTKLENMGLHDLRKHITVEHTLTPYDLQDMYRSNKGSIYGVACKRFTNHALKAPKISQDYKNLYFVGGSCNPGGGIPMVLLGGQQIATVIGDNARSQ